MVFETRIYDKMYILERNKKQRYTKIGNFWKKCVLVGLFYFTEWNFIFCVINKKLMVWGWGVISQENSTVENIGIYGSCEDFGQNDLVRKST